ncbi:PAS domain S-box-containing protein/diguanylate cyclase (GGDEF)-like protein [Nitrosomonas oligotropha]|uniref:PAS domain S-box-containing protein/diguanylate cyclase (GGDEF)-like protein n=1 Tax=Nitrosomonas oligotropha TaxID=42354 RepID=A0A2T5I280_9PROT|nr:EAL domain-containing protein [Nitrosomonas oligotropha]PTQ77945.1 PAS domain S-box-containing protein/diguanylate cyclase (GGDEF)-like protein [Nitrosomonas oligotropha]
MPYAETTPIDRPIAIRQNMFRFFINQDDKKIRVISGLTLSILILSAGFSVYSVMQPQTEAMATSGLRATLENTVRLIENQISHSLANSRTISVNTVLIESLEKFNAAESQHEDIAGLLKTTEKILITSFSGIKIYDSGDNLIVDAGINSSHAHPGIELSAAPGIRTTLLWQEQFIIRNSLPVLNNKNHIIGRITTEEHIPDLTRIFKEAVLIGRTGDFLLCAPIQQSNLDMNCFVRGLDGSQFKRMQRIMHNKPLPVHFALEGQNSVKFTKDYRQVDVVAAHSPVAYGLGAVLKMDEKELYGNFSEQIKAILFYLALLVLIGMAIVYWLTKPLIHKTIKSRNASIKAHEELLQAKNNAEKISLELTAYLNAIGKLALISITDRTGNIIQVNEKFCEVSGYMQEELIGKNHRILNSCTHPKSFFYEMWATIVQGQTWHREVCNRDKSGKLYWVDSTIVPLVNAHGKIDRYLSVRVDITARKQNDLDLSERLKESNCLHVVRNYLEQDQDTEKTCQSILRSLIQALQFSDIAAAAITLGGRQFATAGYQDNLPHAINAAIIANGEACGQLEVAYTQDIPFALPYEQNLIDTIAHDLSRWYERKEAEKRIIEMATHDALTGLPNRHLLQDRIEQALVHDTRSQKQMAVLFIDLDHFKTINDSLGHDIGDLLLQAVAERLLTCVRSEDTVARQGGDEFIVVLNSIAESLDAAKVAQKILDALVHPYYIHKHELHICGSIGIAVFPEDGVNAETLLKNGDAAMYHAKENGRNNYQFFTDELNKSAHERHTLSLDLRYALERNELVLHYQPIMDMPDHQLHSVEALLRWRHPQHKLIAPDKFINLAEETGLIIPIGEWVVKTVCEQINAWQAQGYRIPKVAINLSARQFRDKELINNIARILDETGVAAHHITLEITESMLIDNIEKVVETLNCLNAMGIRISIDDFGTGYSSLSYLKRFPIHTLKIDRTFVRDIVTDRSDHTIVATIIAMAHSLEMDVIAEGIETEEQLNLLRAQHCNHYQGYYFSKPVTAAEIEHMLIKPASRHRKIHAIRSAG